MLKSSKILIVIILFSINSVICAETNIIFLKNEDLKAIYLNQLKTEDINQFIFPKGFNRFGANEYNNLYYSSLLYKNYRRKHLYVYNPLDSSLNMTSDFQFSYVEEKFIFKDNLYFIVSEPDNRKQFVSIIQINHKTPFQSKHYSFRLLGSSMIHSKNIKTGKPNGTITTDSSGNLKILVECYDTKINWDNLLNFIDREPGPIWGKDSDTSVLKWYVFDDDLNLLYIEDGPKRKKSR